MNRTFRLAATLALLTLPLPAMADPLQATLYKNPQCSCCESYADHLRASGFKVEVKPTNDLTQKSKEAAVVAEFQGCHTTIINGYYVDGHVPASVIGKLLSERPAIAGITLPGMPIGSPGMNGTKTQPFAIYAVTKDGAAPTVYATE